MKRKQMTAEEALRWLRKQIRRRWKRALYDVDQYIKESKSQRGDKDKVLERQANLLRFAAEYQVVADSLETVLVWFRDVEKVLEKKKG